MQNLLPAWTEMPDGRWPDGGGQFAPDFLPPPAGSPFFGPVATCACWSNPLAPGEFLIPTFITLRPAFPFGWSQARLAGEIRKRSFVRTHSATGLFHL